MLFWSVCCFCQGVLVIERVLLAPVMIVKASAQCICPLGASTAAWPPCLFSSSALQQLHPSRPVVLKKDSDCICFSHFCCFSLAEYASCGCGPWYRTFVPKVVQLENKHILELPC